MLIETAALCLALNIFYEARGEFVPGQYAVALVTMNRAGGDRRKVCEEVFKPKQFSWTKDVKVTKRGFELPSYLIKATYREPDAWKKAWIIAQVVLKRNIHDFTNGSQWYHSTAVKPIWRYALAPTKKLGSHQFYRLA